MTSTTETAPLRLAVFGHTALADDFRRALRERVAGVSLVEAGDAPPVALADVDADAVIVAAETAARAGLVAAAIGRGLPVCCPLPVAGDLPTLDGLIVRAAEAGVLAFAPNPLRHWLPLAHLHERRGAVGKPAALYMAHRTRRMAEAGDLFTDLALPLVDAALWIVGGVAERVQVMAGRLYGGDGGNGERDNGGDGGGDDRLADTALVLLTFAGGLTATLDLSRSLPDAAPQAHELLVEYLGMDVVLRAAPANMAVEITGAGGTRAVDWLPSPAVSMAETFAAALRSGQGVPQSLVDARWSLAVLEKVRLAAATGEMVRVGGGVVRR